MHFHSGWSTFSEPISSCFVGTTLRRSPSFWLGDDGADDGVAVARLGAVLLLAELDPEAVMAVGHDGEVGEPPVYEAVNLVEALGEKKSTH